MTRGPIGRPIHETVTRCSATSGHYQIRSDRDLCGRGATLDTEKEFWLICGPPIFTSVARWEEHLAWLHEHPNMLGYEGNVRRAEEHIAWLKEHGDPFADHQAARKTRLPSAVVPEPELEALERELDRQLQTRKSGEDQG